MALTDNSRQRATPIGRRTWICTGTTLVVMGMVAIAAELVLQQQLHLSKCHEETHDGIFQSLNVKTGIWFGIPIIFFGLLTISVGICRNKAMMIMLALLSVLFILLALTLLLISEANIVSRYNHNISFKGRGTEVNEEPQPMTAQQGGPYLRFSPSDEIIMLERKILREDHGTKLDGKSSNMNNNNNNDLNIRYQHGPGTKSGNRRVENWPENTEDRGHDNDLDILKQRFSGGKAVKFGEIPLSSADGSSNDIARNTVTTTLVSETRTAEDSSDEWSGSGAGLDDDEDSFRAAEVEPEKDEYIYGLYDSELIEEGEGNKTAEEQHPSVFADWYEDHFSWTRKKRDLSQDCLEVEVVTRQWLIQLMSCLMAAVGFIVLVLSIVMATMIFAPFCCYQKDKLANAQNSSQMQSETSAAAAEKDDISLLSDDATLLQV